jgi:hypothetical protein
MAKRKDADELGFLRTQQQTQKRVPFRDQS